MVIGSARLIWCIVQLTAALVIVTAASAQQSTGQLLISAGFNLKAATSPELMSRLMKFPAQRFVMRSKGGQQYYVYADPSGCGCAYVGTLDAMNRYRMNYQALPSDALSSGGFSDPEQNLINSMDQDDAGAQFNNDVFGPDF